MMKNKYIKSIALSAFSIFTGLTLSYGQSAPFLQFGGKPAQDTTAKVKKNPWEQLTKTAWVVQFGPAVVDDDDAKLGEFKIGSSKNFFPVHTSAEKRVKGNFGVQFAINSESLRPHGFWSTDLHVKYNPLTKSIRDKKIFDPYILVGGGHTYRDFPKFGRPYGDEKDNSMNANVGAGAYLWLFENAGIYVQGVAKFVLLQDKYRGSNYLHYSAGIAFKIGGEKYTPKPIDVPLVPYNRSKEAQDAADYLRQILNK